MRRFLSNCIENDLRLPMVYSECSYNMACYQLEYDYDIVDVITEEKKINGKDYTYIIAKLNTITNKNTVCFVYDEEKGYLMLDDEEKYKNF